MERFGDYVAVRCEAFRDGVRHAPFVYVHDRHEGASGLPRHSSDEEPNGASADDEGGGAGGYGGAVEGVDGY